ncbi:MAG: OPT/YSL family transporter, partial [Planctomycetota bacterium]
GVRQFTLRAVLTGAVFGSLFSVCNIYAGLKIGLVFNMAMPVLLLSLGFWTLLAPLGPRRRRFELLENNIAQTVGSAAALVASAGLFGPVPALAALSGQQLPWFTLALWLFAVCALGIFIGAALRRRMILDEGLAFPAGVACAELLRQVHARGREALVRVLAVAIAAAVGIAVPLARLISAALTQAKSRFAFELPERLPLSGSESWAWLSKLGFNLPFSPLIYAIGALVGLRTGASALLGAVVAWGLLGPWLVQHGYAADASFRGLRDWLLWPGVTLMVTAALTSLALSGPLALRGLRGGLAAARGGLAAAESASSSDAVPGRVLLAGVVLSAALLIALQLAVFGVGIGVAASSCVLAILLAPVAARVSGETGRTPVAQMGKLSQVALGAATGQQPAANIVAANVAAGAASQCADLLDDLKCGHLIGAAPRKLLLAQLAGALAGALAGSAAYLLMMGRFGAQLGTAELPAVAMVNLLAVAKLLSDGLSTLPPGTPVAMLSAALAGIALPVCAQFLPARRRAWCPSATAMGLAFIVSAELAIALFLGGLVAAALRWTARGWSARFLVTICAGLIVGETLMDVISGLLRLRPTP